MKLEDMKTGIRYIVIKSSDNTNFLIGDTIELREKSIIHFVNERGYKIQEEACKGMECKLDKKWARDRISNLLTEVYQLHYNYKLDLNEEC